jgi:hypothetical protein
MIKQQQGFNPETHDWNSSISTVGKGDYPEGSVLQLMPARPSFLRRQSTWKRRSDGGGCDRHVGDALE